ncbi:HNH endonuclease [Aliarcobacter butzleri]|uniref:HNH endonuclease n=1 Tax=Aliarcobacter butzleri TaxID=28197 RepID=UPI003AF5601C
MKLPNFFEFEPLNILRKRMNAKIIQDIEIVKVDVLSEDELSKLTSVGLDISIDDLKVLEDGTLAYKNTRVILYIRDWSFNSGHPKYHISDCKTLQDMRSKGREKRYVISSRDDGVFNVNMNFENKDLKLSLCWNCFKKIKWSEFSSKPFNLDIYFQYFPKSLFQDDYKKDYESPINNYADDWKLISNSLRDKNNWKCEKCGLDCSNNKNFLHVHHINGLKYDNALSNLKILCKSCHSKEPGHNHLL